jgi:ribosomal protein S18 acetylase RimI-like enzyme
MIPTTFSPRPRIELAGADDVPFLWEMLTYAASMSPGGAASVAEAQTNAYLATYVSDWGRPDDLGVVAHDIDEDGAGGARIGAAWVRPGLIVAEPRVPELATAIVPAYRGRGVGAALMHDLFRRATGRFDAIILSVRDGNPALRFYERLGFRSERQLTNRVGGVSYVMRRELSR